MAGEYYNMLYLVQHMNACTIHETCTIYYKHNDSDDTYHNYQFCVNNTQK